MINKILPYILTGASLALAGCDDGPKVKRLEDLTGDGILDVIVKEDGLGSREPTYLFIGKEDGTFIRAKKSADHIDKYFTTDDGVIYFFDGEIYRESPKDEKTQ